MAKMPLAQCATESTVRAMFGQHRQTTVGSLTRDRSIHPPRGIAVPFLVGTVVGGLAGAVAGTLLSAQTTHLVASLIDAVERRVSDADREALRWELMLQ